MNAFCGCCKSSYNSFLCNITVSVFVLKEEVQRLMLNHYIDCMHDLCKFIFSKTIKTFILFFNNNKYGIFSKINWHIIICY